MRGCKQKNAFPNSERHFGYEPLGLRYLSFVNCDASLVLWAFELDLTVDECEDGEVSTDSHARTWVELGAALSDDDCAWLDDFSAVLLNAASLTVTVATVSS